MSDDDNGVAIRPIPEPKAAPLKRGQKPEPVNPYAPKPAKPVPLFGADVESAFGPASISAPAPSADGTPAFANVKFDLDHNGSKETTVTATREGTLTTKSPGKPDVVQQNSNAARDIVGGVAAAYDGGAVNRIEADGIVAQTTLAATTEAYPADLNPPADRGAQVKAAAGKAGSVLGGALNGFVRSQTGGLVDLRKIGQQAEPEPRQAQSEDNELPVTALKAPKPPKGQKADPNAPKMYGVDVQTGFGPASISAPAPSADGTVAFATVKIDLDRNGSKETTVTGTKDGKLTIQTPGKNDVTAENNNMARALAAGVGAAFQSNGVSRDEAAASVAEGTLAALSASPSVASAAAPAQGPAQPAPRR